MGYFILIQNNAFDYGVQFLTSGLQLYKFNQGAMRNPQVEGGYLCTKFTMCKFMGLWILDQLLTNI